MAPFGRRFVGTHGTACILKDHCELRPAVYSAVQRSPMTYFETTTHQYGRGVIRKDIPTELDEFSATEMKLQKAKRQHATVDHESHSHCCYLYSVDRNETMLVDLLKDGVGMVALQL